MSEPFVRYDKDGNEVVMYAPLTAEALVEAGELFLVAPEKPASPPKKRAPRRKTAKAEE